LWRNSAYFENEIFIGLFDVEQYFFCFFKVIDGSRYQGCSVQSGWGKMCAKSFSGSSREGSACPGDSGSPLVTWDATNGGWTLIGLLSNGAKSCFEGNPEIYTKVGDYLPWIFDTMKRPDINVP